jgi:hypothetical protein
VDRGGHLPPNAPERRSRGPAGVARDSGRAVILAVGDRVPAAPRRRADASYLHTCHNITAPPRQEINRLRVECTSTEHLVSKARVASIFFLGGMSTRGLERAPGPNAGGGQPPAGAREAAGDDAGGDAAVADEEPVSEDTFRAKWPILTAISLNRVNAMVQKELLEAPLTSKHLTGAVLCRCQASQGDHAVAATRPALEWILALIEERSRVWRASGW